jgi:pimeloyl-ACP methyl ester carboxylesterase
MSEETLPAITIHDEILLVKGHRLAIRHLTPEPFIDSAGPTVVFLHEALGSISQWKRFPERLCAALGLKGLVFDRIGYGGSDRLPAARTPDYLREQGEDWLPAVLTAAGLDQPPVVFGHSDGGSIALYFAAVQPAAAVITEAAHVIIEPITQQGIRDFGTLWDTTDIASKLARYHGDKTETVYRAWHDTWLQPDFAAFDMRPCLPSISAPALVIQGADDQYGSPEQVHDIVAGIRKGGKAPAPEAWFIPGCGHIPHLEAGDGVIAKTAIFLRQHQIGVCAR